MPFPWLRTAHLHIDDGAEDRAVQFIVQRELNTDADWRVAHRDREVEEVRVLSVGGQRARARAQMDARVLEVGRQRIRHSRGANDGTHNRSQSVGWVGVTEVNLHLGFLSLSDLAWGRRAAGNAQLRRQTMTAGAWIVRICENARWASFRKITMSNKIVDAHMDGSAWPVPWPEPGSERWAATTWTFWYVFRTNVPTNANATVHWSGLTMGSGFYSRDELKTSKRRVVTWELIIAYCNEWTVILLSFFAAQVAGPDRTGVLIRTARRTVGRIGPFWCGVIYKHQTGVW